MLVLGAIEIIGPFFAPHGPTEFVTLPAPHPGGEAGLLGTDYLGQDVLSRFLHGGLEILVMAIVSTTFCLVLGTAIGLVAAYSRNA